MENEVRQFLKKYGFPTDLILKEQNTRSLFDVGVLQQISIQLKDTITIIKDPANSYRKEGDERLYRLYLILGEVLEICNAFVEKDIVELADGLADLHYVTEGTGITFGIPLASVFEEVHRSNMTKNLSDVKDNETREHKTEQFSPPDIEGVLVKWMKIY